MISSAHISFFSFRFSVSIFFSSLSINPFSMEECLYISCLKTLYIALSYVISLPLAIFILSATVSLLFFYLFIFFISPSSPYPFPSFFPSSIIFPSPIHHHTTTSNRSHQSEPNYTSSTPLLCGKEVNHSFLPFYPTHIPLPSL